MFQPNGSREFRQKPMHAGLSPAWLYQKAVDAPARARHQIRSPTPKYQDWIAMLSSSAE
jgi:hypothetical protein